MRSLDSGRIVALISVVPPIALPAVSPEIKCIDIRNQQS
jgi:hypothetical protein